MFSHSAVNRTVTLLLSMLVMAALWGLGTLSDADLPPVTYTFLTSVFLLDISSFSDRVRLTLQMAGYAAAVQFIFSITGEVPFLQIILSAAVAYYVFLTLPDHRAGCIVLLTGYMVFSASPGFLPAAERCFNIFIGSIVILVITSIANAGRSFRAATQFQLLRYSPRQALRSAAELGIGTAIFKLLQIQQGAWIMLTILFINMSSSDNMSREKLAWQRIVAVPVGIIAGGVILSAFSRIDPRLVWLIPFIGASGFFILYNDGDFFMFSIIFMVTLTFFSDLMKGAYHSFDFRETLFSRTISTLLGAVLVLLLPMHKQSKEKESA